MWVCIMMLVLGLVIFTIGLVKALRSKCSDLSALVWLWIGVEFINAATAISMVVL